MKKLVVLSGAGVSAESGLKTFRDGNGLWEEYDVMDVASIEGWHRNPELVLQFYNARRRQLETVQPNGAHRLLAELEKDFEVHVITQNVDNLHERAGSTRVIHLHGELTKARSTKYPELIYDIGTKDINKGDLCEKGSQLRPHIVWFGEAVPMMDRASEIAARGDVFLVIGTSLNVYPAAGLAHSVADGTPVFVIDPGEVHVSGIRNVTYLRLKATKGLQEFLKLIPSLK